jgi:low affinity Fe/Cu permease
MFEKFSRKVSDLTGSPYAFLASFFLILGWLATGPAFHFSEEWQLVINSTTTVITFLMVFLIQHAQNLDTEALHLKLDELIIAVDAANNKAVEVEKHKEDIKDIRERHRESM